MSNGSLSFLSSRSFGRSIFPKLFPFVCCELDGSRSILSGREIVRRTL